MKNHLSIKAKVADVETARTLLRTTLHYYCSSSPVYETDTIYGPLINKSGQMVKYKFRQGDAALNRKDGRTFIEEILTPNDRSRDTKVYVDKNISRQRFEQHQNRLGMPDCVVSKERLIFVKSIGAVENPRDPDLRIYVDSKVAITDRKGEQYILPGTFIELQIGYSLEKDKEKMALRLQEYLAEMAITEKDVVTASYSDMPVIPKATP